VQNLDINRLENSGKLKIFYLVDDVANEQQQQSADSKVQKETLGNWNDLLQWKGHSSSGSSGAKDEERSAEIFIPSTLFIDDLDMLELLAPTCSAARLYLGRVLGNIGGSAGLNGANSAFSFDSVVCFGRDLGSSSAALNGGGSLGGYGVSAVSPSAAATSFEGVGGCVEQSGASDRGTGYCGAISLEQSPSLCEYSKYRADVIICVSALASGYSSAVHGVITTTRRSQLPSVQKLHFKALDTGVVCALVGTTRFC
jgi:hypothetical protein